MRLLVCGGRDFSSADAWNWLERNAKDEIAFATGCSAFSIDVLIHGGARGADEGGARWGESEHAEVLCFPADWKKHGKSAGPIRNRKMLEEGKPDIVIAMPGGKGTANMMAQARAHGVSVIEVSKTRCGLRERERV